MIGERVEIGGEHAALAQPDGLRHVGVEADLGLGVGDRFVDGGALEIVGGGVGGLARFQRLRGDGGVGAARDLGQRLVCASARAFSASATASEGSISSSTSPAFTCWPLTTWIAATLPLSNGWITLARLSVSILPGATAWTSSLPKNDHASAQAKNSADRQHQRDRQRRRRRLQDLERRGQEFAVAAPDRRDRRRPIGGAFFGASALSEVGGGAVRSFIGSSLSPCSAHSRA